MVGENQRYLGWVLVSLSAVAWSTAGFFTRLIEEDVWTMLFWRGFFGGLAFVVMSAVQYRGKVARRLYRHRRARLVLAVTPASAWSLFIGSLMLTTVADVYVIYATVPFVTAGVAWLVLRKELRRACSRRASSPRRRRRDADRRRLWRQPARPVRRLHDDAHHGLMAVILRWKRDIPIMPALGLSAWIAAFVSFWFCEPFDVSSFDLAMLALFGVTQSALGLVLVRHRLAHDPGRGSDAAHRARCAARALWVWLAFDEVPSPYTIAGGVIVLAAVAGHIWHEMRNEQAPAAS